MRHRGNRKESGARQVVQLEKSKESSDGSICLYAISLLVIRLLAALFSPIMDCDETFNYWEPLHMLSHGSGMQTWEYSPEYALRSYAMLLPFVAVVKTLKLMGVEKVVQFYTIRVCLSLFATFGDLLFATRNGQNVSPGLCKSILWLQIFSVGAFIASPALLPSSISMSFTTYAYAFWISGSDFTAVLCIALSSLLSWPFASLLGLPIATEMIMRGRVKKLISHSAIAALSILAFTVPVDSLFFGRLVIAPLNILLYNVFSIRGPELYGTEPFLFYVKNLLLNWNVTAIMALLSLPLMILQRFQGVSKASIVEKAKLYQYAMWLWIAVFFKQPHKEERFLFPMYPMLCVNAALSLEYLKRPLSMPKRLYNFVYWSVLCGACLFSISRIAFVTIGFSAPMYTYLDAKGAGAVCVGKEWHRFPSSFFLNDRASLQFLQSEFRGQLPKSYSTNFSTLLQSTRQIPADMNDQNREETSRYVSVERCSYVVDLIEPDAESSLQPNYAAMEDTFKVQSIRPFLLPRKSAIFCKHFYLPTLIGQCHFGQYVLLSKLKRSNGTGDSG